MTAALPYNGGTLASGLPGAPLAQVVASAGGAGNVTANFTPTPTFYQFTLPAGARPQWIAAGSDGNMWFTEFPNNAVARITPAWVVTEFTVPTAASNPQGIIGASDGNLWFTEFNASKIARLTTTGTFTEFTTLFGADQPLLLMDRGDGNVWYTGSGGNHVGFQGLTSGISGETTIPTANSRPFGISTAPDNNVYFTESNTDKIGRISDLFGTVSELAIRPNSQPGQMVRGPDGNLWFVESAQPVSRIGRLNPTSFSVTGEFPTVTPMSSPTGIVVGQDGALWFTENAADKIGRVTTSGAVSEFSSPVVGLSMKGIAVAPDGSLWFCEPGSGLNPGRIGKLVY
ncbi:MAG: virginiamycin B lyase [Candidatus Elarobacter sp.]